MRSNDTKRDALNRLSYIEGHLKGIRKMVEEDQYCVDVSSRPMLCSAPSTSSRACSCTATSTRAWLRASREGARQEVLGELGRTVRPGAALIAQLHNHQIHTEQTVYTNGYAYNDQMTQSDRA